VLNYKYNDVQYLIGLFGVECSLADIHPEYKKTVEEANNLRHAFTRGCDAQQKIDKEWNVK
jgi:hypothetical protein